MKQIADLVSPLLETLQALGHIGRHMHPPDLFDVIAHVHAPLDELRAARAAPPWPDPYSALRLRIDASADEALAAFDGLNAAATVPEAIMDIFRAMRHVPRALEELYPLAGILPPVSRFFLMPQQRDDNVLGERLMRRPPNTGLMCFGDDPDGRDAAWMYVPESYEPDVPHPVVVALHGGSGRGRGFLWSWLAACRSRGAILVAPTSLGPTWAIQGEDADSPRLAAMLEFVRSNWSIDPSRLLLTGMSDGGTFSYVSGLDAGSPFTHLAPVAAAFHPMLAMAEAERLQGLPIHIIHGKLDWMFPVDMARNAQRHFTGAGANVAYREIDDLSHTYSLELSAMILDWLLA